MGIKLDLKEELSLTTTSLGVAPPVHADGRLGAGQRVRLHAGTANVDVGCEADIKHTGIVVDLRRDFFVAFLEHPACAGKKSSRLLARIATEAEYSAVYLIFFPPLLAQQDVALFGVAWFSRGWDRRRGLLAAMGQSLIAYVPLGSSVGARAVNGAVGLSAVVLLVIVKGSLRRSKGKETTFTWNSSLT